MAISLSNDELPSTIEMVLRTRGPEILHQVGEAPIFQKEATREYPTFTREEIEFGKVLGVGAFGVVREVARIYKREHSDEAIFVTEQVELCSSNGDLHDDVSTARKRMATKCIRQGDARYAVKYLRPHAIEEEERALGRIDLAIEIKYLHALDHPNIVKMRGVFETVDEFHPEHFFLMDRLYGTLDEKIEEWLEVKRRNSTKGLVRLISKLKHSRQDNEALKDLMAERLVVAYDIASAFAYMHSHKIVYRDIKLSNIGFDIRGDVKIFDFGLAKSMRRDLRTKHRLYHLTALTGSIPYMAPEVASSSPYNEKSDVYSFGILLWTILSLKPPFMAFPSLNEDDGEDYMNVVVKGGARPPIKAKWPSLTRKVLKWSWVYSIHARPSMSTICNMLSTDFVELTKEENIHQRTKNMMDLSSNSDISTFNSDEEGTLAIF